MRGHRSGGSFERELRAEVRRIRLLLERCRRTRAQTRLALARKSGISRGRWNSPDAARYRPVPFRRILPVSPRAQRGD